jgi:hypothetical protein
MRSIVYAGLAYFSFVLGSGYALGMVRVPFLVPRIGERWAELAEMPIMATVIFFAAGYILRRFPSVNSPVRSLAVGGLALVLSVCAELALAAVLQNQSVLDYLRSRDKISGSVYLAVLVLFALMPRIRLGNHHGLQDQRGVA